jgi:hypothetical protein
MENIKKKKEERKERKKQFCIESQGLMYMQHRESGAPADPLKSIPFRLVDRNAISAA